jgi:hypothetical protein
MILTAKSAENAKMGNSLPETGLLSAFFAFFAVK